MSKAYYHNLTKGWFNENDFKEAAETADPGDVIMMSFRGNALLFDLLKSNQGVEENGEHNWARKQFLDYFKEFHGCDFNQA